MSPQKLLLKAQDSVLGGGKDHRMCFQPSDGYFHNCKHMDFALGALWECDIVNLPGFLMFIF